MTVKYNKYKNKKTVIDGITFDSKKEAKRYQELKILEKKGEIVDLELQPKYLLQDKFECQGVKHRAIYYIADFRYIDVESGQLIVEDVKGLLTEVFKIKEKLLLYKYGKELTFRKI